MLDKREYGDIEWLEEVRREGKGVKLLIKWKMMH
jgi:hypothetical protein